MALLDRTAVCTHMPGSPEPPRFEACEGCGSRVNLRVCLDCGHVGCCESQQGHNTAHFRSSGHAVIRSMPVSVSSFTWCYICDRYL